MMRIIKTAPSYIVSKPLVKARMWSEKVIKNGDTLVHIAIDGSDIANYMKTLGYENSFLRKYRKPLVKYLDGSIKAGAEAGIKQRKRLILRLISTHNCAALWLRWIPIILMPTIVYRQISKLKLLSRKISKPVEAAIKKRLRK